MLVLDDVSLGFAMSPSRTLRSPGYLQFQDTPEVREWLGGPFFRAVCKVS